MLGAGSAGCTADAFCACSPWWVKASVTRAPTAIAATALSTRTPRRRREAGRRPRWECLCSHRRNVVAATVDQGGSPLVPGVKPCCCSPISAPPQPRGIAELYQIYLIIRVLEISPIQSLIACYVAKFAILTWMTTVRFLPDKADHELIFVCAGAGAQPRFPHRGTRAGPPG